MLIKMYLIWVEEEKCDIDFRNYYSKRRFRFGIEIFFNNTPRVGTTFGTLPLNKKLKNELGWEPKISTLLLRISLAINLCLKSHSRIFGMVSKVITI